ncbi:glycosyltransferase family 2 protein [Terriglobus sp. RCC_193]|uniref:glycosyltransferase family 2 protein n=1 Tax=Terriglobus sp. RCC_193 TaxID=3239218 RepID=UPI0035269984
MLFSLPSASDVSPWSILFWTCATAIGYTYVGYPTLLCLITRFRKHCATTPSTSPTLTLLICAHDEAANIGRKLLQCLELNYPKEKLQILVASDGSTDATEDVVRFFSPEGVELIVVPQQAGKTNAQNVAIRSAKGEIVVFSDATTEYHPDALQYLAGAFVDPNVGAVSGRYTYYDLSSSSVGVASRAYAGYDNQIREMQSAAGSLTGCCGCIYAVRRSLYTPLDPSIISDLVEPMHVLLQGAKVKFEPRALAREDVGHNAAKEFSMRVRVIARALTGLASVRQLLAPWKHPWIALQLFSHKLLRYAVPLFLIGMLASSWMLRASTVYGVLLALQFAFYAIAALVAIVPSLQKGKFLSLPMYFCVMNGAALWGTVKFLRGQRYAVWKPQRETSHAG